MWDWMWDCEHKLLRAQHVRLKVRLWAQMVKNEHNMWDWMWDCEHNITSYWLWACPGRLGSQTDLRRFSSDEPVDTEKKKTLKQLHRLTSFAMFFQPTLPKHFWDGPNGDLHSQHQEQPLEQPLEHQNGKICEQHPWSNPWSWMWVYEHKLLRMSTTCETECETVSTNC